MLRNPLPGQVVASLSYQRNYKGYSQLLYTPELAYFNDEAGLHLTTASINDVYASLNGNGLYNGKIFQDAFL